MLGIHNYKKESRDLMTGTLAAIYGKTGDAHYKKEYIRRLKYIGFSGDDAEKMLDYEVGITKEYVNDLLADPKYIYTDYFDFSKPILSADRKTYAEQQIFTVSEVSKICDEAAWHAENSRYKMKRDDVADEVNMLASYGENGLLQEYLRIMAEKSGVNIGLIQKYSVSEQNLLIMYKWNDDSQDVHPYGA